MTDETKTREFGEYIQRLRESRGYSINQLAMQAKVSAGHISRVERGEREIPTPAFLQKLANGLRVPYESLMEAAGYIDERIEGEISDPEWQQLFEAVKAKGMELEATTLLRSASKLSKNQLRDLLKIFSMIEAEEAEDDNKD